MERKNLQVVPQCTQEEDTILWDQCQLATERLQADISDVLVVYENISACYIHTSTGGMIT